MANRVVILGAGESGVGSAILARKIGFTTFISDIGHVKDKYRDILRKYDIEFEENGHSENKILNADLIIKSPGISENAPVIVSVRGKGIPVISEIEFAGRFSKSPTICITGSNGKTTTTLLTHHVLKSAGIDAGLAGNVGKSFAWQVAEEEHEMYVLELSSFQLDGMFDFRPHISVIMNITADHLDRYGYNMRNYIDSKFRIIQNQDETDFFIYCSDDPVIRNEISNRIIRPVLLPFSLSEPVEEGGGLSGNKMVLNFNKKSFSMSILDLALQGKHNTYNSMAAGIASMVLEIRNDVIRKSLSDFQGVEHRLEHFLKVHGIEFINDSKATNINSTWYALESIPKSIVWIAGGIDKGNDYSMLADLVREKVKAIVCIGKDNLKIHEAFKGMVKDIVDVKNMEEAVKTSYYLARNGDSVLLSPACASFDRFDNYEDRGKQFKEAVRDL